MWLRTDFLEDTANALGNGGLVLMPHKDVLKVDDSLLYSFNTKAFHDATDDFVQFGAAWTKATDRAGLNVFRRSTSVDFPAPIPPSMLMITVSYGVPSGGR